MKLPTEQNDRKSISFVIKCKKIFAYQNWRFLVSRLIDVTKNCIFWYNRKVMKYRTLKNVYYTDSDNHKAIYEERFNAPHTKHLPFSIKQFNRKSEYPAFLCYTEELFLLMEKLYRRYEKFSHEIKNVPPLVLYQFALSCVLDEVNSTNAIEGIQSTRRELKEVMEGLSEKPRFLSIIKKYDMLIERKKFNFETCEDIRKFYDEFAHEEVCIDKQKNKLDGKLFRKDFVDVKSPTEKTLHRGIYPEEKIIQSMDTALKILNDEEIPFLVRISIFHYYFAYIHPFYDGNGRTVRFITSYFISEHFHYLAALRLSVVIKRDKNKYYNLFNETSSEINCGDMMPFVYGFISILMKTFDEISERLKNKMEQLKKYQQKLLEIIPDDEIIQKIYFILLQSATFFGRGISVEELAELTHKSKNTIRTRLKFIPQEHIIIRSNKKYFYKLNMAIFKRNSKSTVE